VEEGVGSRKDIMLGLRYVLASNPRRIGMKLNVVTRRTFWIKVLIISSLGRRPSGVTRILPCLSKTAAAKVTLCALLVYPFRVRAEEMARKAMRRHAATD